MPIALQSLIGSSLAFVDNLMVGTLGEKELSAVGVGIQPFFIFWMVTFGFVSGTAAFMSQFFGNKDMANIKKTLGFAICVSMSIGIAFFIVCMFFPGVIVNIFTDIEEIKPLAIEYIQIGAPCFLFLAVTVPLTFCLRSTQQAKIPLFTSSFAFCMNTLFNYILIFGNFGAPRLEVAGAAMATIIARSLELALVLFVIFYKKNIISGGIKEYFGWKKGFSGRIFGVAVPTTLNETLWGVGFAMYTAAYARVGVTAFAAVQMARAIEHIFIMAAFSIGDAALILVGQRFGAGEPEYGFLLAKKLLKIGAAFGAVAGLALIAIAKPVISLYKEFTPEGAAYAFYILVIYGLFMGIVVFNGMSVTGVLRSGGDTKYAMFIDCGCVWLIGVPMAFFTTQWLGLPIHLAVLLVSTEEIVKFYALLRRFKSKKWVRNVIKNM